MWILLVGLALAATAADTGAPGTDTGVLDTGVPAGLDDDADGDGFTPRDGDCDDTNPRVSPRAAEICNDRIDNDCDGFFDNGEECTIAARQGTLRGGGGCTGEGAIGNAALLFLVPGLRRRRRRTARGA